jgi:hypothetical protein
LFRCSLRLRPRTRYRKVAFWRRRFPESWYILGKDSSSLAATTFLEGQLVKSQSDVTDNTAAARPATSAARTNRHQQRLIPLGGHFP